MRRTDGKRRDRALLVLADRLMAPHHPCCACPGNPLSEATWPRSLVNQNQFRGILATRHRLRPNRLMALHYASHAIEDELLDWVADVVEEEQTKSLSTRRTADNGSYATSMKADVKSPSKKRKLPVPSNETITFVEKTFYLMNSCDDDIASWNPSGSGFVILNVESFAREVLPEYFKNHNWIAFVSELRLHGFTMRRFHGGNWPFPSYEFCHPNFKRGNARLLDSITRRSRTSGILTTSNEDEDEDMDVEEAVGELKYQINALQGEVRQTQELFGELLASMTARASSAVPVWSLQATRTLSAHVPLVTPPPPTGTCSNLTGHIQCVSYC